MRFFLLILSIIIAGFITQQILPWWTIILVAGLVSLAFNLTSTQRFFAAFIAVFLLWGGYAGWLNQLNESLLATRMGTLMGGQSALMMILCSDLLGGLFGGLGALTASLGLDLMKQE